MRRIAAVLLLLINLNTANVGQLQTLPGIGPTLARRIIDFRERNHGFKRIEELLGGRMRVAQLYEQALGGHPLLKLPPSVPDCQRSWFVYPVQLLPPAAVPDGSVRDRVLSELRARGVGCQSYFPAIHLQPCFQEGHLAQQGPLPHTEAASNTCLVLPMFSSATEEQIGYVSKTLLEILEGESRGLAAHCDWTDRFRGQETAAV